MQQYRVLTLNAIAAAGLRRFSDERYLVGNDVDEPHAVLVRSRNLRDVAIPTSVRAIARAGVGTNTVPVGTLSKRGVPVFNTPGANANAVKELVLTALLLAARNVIPAIGYVRALEPETPDLERIVEDGKKQFAGVELPGKTLGIVGLGAVGSMVADTAIKLGMSVIGFDPEITVDAAWRLPSSVRKAHVLDELLRQSDFVTLHLPLLDATRNLIAERQLAQMRPSASLLNFARDAIVDDTSVIDALRSSRLKYYLCDFPQPRLLREPGVVALPHLGASTEEAEQNCAIMAVDQLRGFLEHGTITNSVNFPNVEMARESPYRVAIANANVPNMLGQISTAMAHAGLNIHNMVNKSRGEMAYTLVDVDSPVPDALLAALSAIDGVLSVRAIPADVGEN